MESLIKKDGRFTNVLPLFSLPELQAKKTKEMSKKYA
jgi:hypothetical protein